VFSFKIWLENHVRDNPDPFVVLDLPKSASQKEVEQQYKKLSMLYQRRIPTMSAINKAYEKINQGLTHKTSPETPETIPVANRFNNNNNYSILDARSKMIDYTPGQKKALLEIQKIIDGSESAVSSIAKHYLLAGYAGTGKTTLAENIVRYSMSKGMKVRVIAPTNKAAMILSEKLRESGVNLNPDSISTIHKTIYGTPASYYKDRLNWELSSGHVINDTVFIIDESSMINKTTMNDLLELTKFHHNVLIFMGDSYQLQPVGQDAGLFHGNVSQIGSNKSELKEVKRQALDSNVLKIATLVRGDAKPYIPSESIENFKVCETKKEFLDNYKESLKNNEDVIMIVATNKERMLMNSFAREVRFGDNKTILNSKESLISLANSEHLKNGEVFTIENFNIQEDINIEEISSKIYLGSAKIPKSGSCSGGSCPLVFIPDFEKPAFPHQFLIDELKKEMWKGNGKSILLEKLKSNNMIENSDAGKIKINKDTVIATYGYAVTAHKSQGSQWKKVFIYQNFMSDTWDNTRWYYTAITRSTKDVIVLNSGNNILISQEEINQKIQNITI